VGRMGAKNLGLFHRLGITLVILGMLQSVAPTCFRPGRSSLRIHGRLRVALLTLTNVEPVSRLAWSGMSMTAEPVQDQESDQESHDTENPAETYTWSLTVSAGRSVQRSGGSVSFGAGQKPRMAAERTLCALQRSRVLPILSAASSSVTTRYCRFLC
jgi:hypothetical protein